MRSRTYKRPDHNADGQRKQQQRGRQQFLPTHFFEQLHTLSRPLLGKLADLITGAPFRWFGRGRRRPVARFTQKLLPKNPLQAIITLIALQPLMLVSLSWFRRRCTSPAVR